MAAQQPLITNKALDALEVSPEVFINTVKETLAHVQGGSLGEVPLMFGHVKESMRPMGTIYIIPKGKRRAAFPVLWDTERNKYRYPELFQALNGPSWGDAFDMGADNNGTLHVTDSSINDLGKEVTGLPDLIDDYLKERVKYKDHIDEPSEDLEDGTMLLFRPLFSAVDRCVSVMLGGSDLDENTTKFVKELYGFHPHTDLPGVMVGQATEGLPSGYGIPEIRVASKKSDKEKDLTYRYLSAPSLKDAKKALKNFAKFYTSYQIASSRSRDKAWPIFRFKVEAIEGVDMGSIREVRSEAEDVATTKFASTDSGWLTQVESGESHKMASTLFSALDKLQKSRT